MELGRPLPLIFADSLQSIGQPRLHDDFGLVGYAAGVAFLHPEEPLLKKLERQSVECLRVERCDRSLNLLAVAGTQAVVARATIAIEGVTVGPAGRVHAGPALDG